MADTQQSKSPSTSTFHPFTSLPTELRLRIWQTALEDATIGRLLPVAVYHQLFVTSHTCWTTQRRFCGNHDKCLSYQPRTKTLTSNYMTDGYFVNADKFLDEQALRSFSVMLNVSLACRESRSVVTQRYPKVLRVYPEHWSPGMPSRLLRCCPVTDMLLIAAVPDLSLCSPIETMPNTESPFQQRQEFLDRIFPRDAALFSEFRDIVSSFRRVAFYHCPKREVGSERDDKKVDLFTSADLRALLKFFVSLEQLLIWFDPGYWASIDAIPVIIDNVNDIMLPSRRKPVPLVQLIDGARELMDYYKRVVEINNNHFAESDKYWAVRAKRLKRVGCFGAPSWPVKKG